MKKKNKNEEIEKVWVPSPDSESLVLNPAINFLDEDVYVGLRIRVREVNTGETQKQFWFLTSKGLIPLEKIVNDRDYFIEKPLTYFWVRPSKRILESKNIPEMEVQFTQLFSSKNKNENNVIKKVGCTPYKHKIISAQTAPVSSKIWKSNKKITTLTALLFEKICSKINYYIDFEDRNCTHITALWIIGTYFHRLFSAYPYLYLTGVKRSGKTTLLKLISYLAFNPMLCGSLTTSSMFRFIDGASPTLLIDDQDWLAAYKQDRGELVDLLKNGYKQGDYVLRSERPTQKEKFRPVMFDTYCPKAISNIKGMDDILEERCITIIMERTLSKEYSDRVANMDYDPDWQDIVDGLYVMLFCNYKEIQELYSTLENTTSLLNRDWELWKPLLTIALFIDEDLYKKMVDIAIKESEAKEIESLSEPEINLLDSLKELVQEKRYYKVKEIKEKMLEKYEEQPKFLNNWWIGRCMKRFGFKQKRRVKSRMEYYLTYDDVMKKRKRLGIIDEEITEWVDTGE
ncbi:MAG: hypothetical protein ACTSUF_09705 [Candidatus Heimdallarchaeaceae archaeon]